jgi:hypothetical protein
MKKRYRLPFYLLTILSITCVIILLSTGKELPGIEFVFIVFGILGYVLKSKNIYIKSGELFLIYFYFNCLLLILIIVYLLL